MLNESSLPIGSCVKIVNNSKMIMIAGFFPCDDEKKIMYDYIGIYTPIGIRKPKSDLVINKDYVLFNSRNIEKILFIGYSNKKEEEYHKFLYKLKDKCKKIKTDIDEEMIKEIFEELSPELKEIKSEE